MRPTFFLLASLLLADTALAQQFSYGIGGPRAVQSLSFGYTVVDFRYDGDGSPRTSFAFSEPAYGAVYTRPNLQAAIAFGEQPAADTAFDGRPRRLVDASLTTWGEWLLGGTVGGPARVFVPIALHTDYRRVSQRGEESSLAESFNVTVLGLGAGLGFEGRFGERLTLEARATPIIGIAVRNFGDSAGNARLLDADVQLHAGQLAGRFGLSLGYGYRYQIWNGTSSTLLQDLAEDLFDYRGSQHVFRVGVNW